MKIRIGAILLSFSILTNSIGIAPANSAGAVGKYASISQYGIEVSPESGKPKEPKQNVPKEENGKKTEADGKKEETNLKSEQEIKKAHAKRLALFANEYSGGTKGWFYVFIRKEGELYSQGDWFQVTAQVPKNSSERSQFITWSMKELGAMPEAEINKTDQWLMGMGAAKPEQGNSANVKYNFRIYTERKNSDLSKNWNRTRDDGWGKNPVLENKSYVDPPLANRKYVLCGKFLYHVTGYRLYFDNSILSHLSGMDIEPGNIKIQKDASWTDDTSYKFGVNTNNAGMTDYGTTKMKHHAKYGFILRPNTYTIAYHANGGTGSANSQTARYDEAIHLRRGSSLRRIGYELDSWNSKRDGSGTRYELEGIAENLTAVNGASVTLYAQWRPKIYKAVLNSYGADLAQGSFAVYQKYDTGWYADQSCRYALTEKGTAVNQGITIPQRRGYKFEGYYDSAAGGRKMIGADGKLTNEGIFGYQMSSNVVWYARWTPHTLRVTYQPNGGSVSGTPVYRIGEFAHNWSFGAWAAGPADFAVFGLERRGYSPKSGAEWNIQADGRGKSFSQSLIYEMTDYAPSLTNGNQEVTLYAQWEPNVYTVTLDNQLFAPEKSGTGEIYKKYANGWYVEKSCRNVLSKIETPVKDGYQFLGYYTKTTGGRQMIDQNGKLTTEGEGCRNTDGNETWYAQYNYRIACEDYADIPCDLKKTENDDREDPGVQISYDENTGKTTVFTGKSGCTVSFTGCPAGTEAGEFRSSVGGSSAAGETKTSRKAEISLTVREGAAYQLRVFLGARTVCDRLIYFSGGRFRTLVKLGMGQAAFKGYGSAAAGSDWGTEAENYALYQYYGCSKLANITAPGAVCRYFRYKDVHVAYSGNGATAGYNILEPDVSLENFYQFRDNCFTRVEKQTKHTADKKRYECQVKYGFQGWETSSGTLYSEKRLEQASAVYDAAKKENVLSNSTAEDIETYRKAEPIAVKGSAFLFSQTKAAGGLETFFPSAKDFDGFHAKEYINFLAKWNAFPTIVVTPGNKLEFYEGETVTKKDLIDLLTSHDQEDCGGYYTDLNDKIRIVKISYPESKNKSQGAYEKIYKNDVPQDFSLDTYYLKLEKDETVDVRVTFAVTDSVGNTTEEEIPVIIKYNNYPQINSEDIFYYLKEEANRGEIGEEALLKRAAAKDAEDGEITEKLKLKDFDPQAIKLQTESKGEFSITYQVTDAYQKTSFKTVTLIVWDEDAAIAEMPNYYVRYISEKHLDTLEKNSSWREPENFAYLKSILQNETPLESWEFTHEDIIAIQQWIMQSNQENWKIGREANRQFLKKFAYCRK